MMRHKHKKESSGILRFLRTIVSIVVLSAFVLSVSYFVKGVSTFDYSQALDSASPYLYQVGINPQSIGKVAGVFSKRDSKSNSEKSPIKTNNVAADTPSEDQAASSQEKEVILKVALISDSHNYNGLLTEALKKAKEGDATAVFYLGDMTDWGDVSSLQNVKATLDAGGLPYYVIPGDHDIAQSTGPENFLKVFDTNYDMIVLAGMNFLMLDNSANYTAIPQNEMDWFKGKVEDADFVLMHQPIYNPNGDAVMGVVNGEEVKMVKEQASEILDLIRNSTVEAVITGDLHKSSVAKDPERSNLKHIVVGAVTESRNLQTPRFSILKIYTGGDFDVEDVVLE